MSDCILTTTPSIVRVDWPKKRNNNVLEASRGVTAFSLYTDINAAYTGLTQERQTSEWTDV